MKVQRFNKKIKAWVLFNKTKNGILKIINVKQYLPSVKFKGVKVL